MDTENNRGKIVWVFGSSAAGKETFLRYFQKNNPEELIQKLNWGSQPVIICEESIDWVAQFDNDPLGIKRTELPSIVKDLSNSDQKMVILIKGQDLDFKNNSLFKLKEMLPNFEHQIFFLEVSISEIMNRLRSKSWFADRHTKEIMQKWLDYQISLLRGVQNDFPVTVIDAENKDSYSIVRYSIDRRHPRLLGHIKNL